MSLKLESNIDFDKILECSTNVALGCSTKRISTKQIIEKGTDININEKRAFTHLDFESVLTAKSFSTRMHRCSDIFIKVGNSRPTEWKVRGIELPAIEEIRSAKGTGARAVTRSAIRYNEMLCNCLNQDPQFHKIKLSFKSNFHKALLSKGLSVNKSNSLIQVNDPSLCSFNPYLTISLSVYPKVTIMDIGCSKNPLIYNTRSLISLTCDITKYILNIERKYILDLSTYPVSDWILSEFHLNKDSGLSSVNISDLNLTWTENTDVLYQLYNKDFGNGRKYLRIEQQLKKQNISFDELLKQVSTGQMKWRNPTKIPKWNDMSK